MGGTVGWRVGRMGERRWAVGMLDGGGGRETRRLEAVGKLDGGEKAGRRWVSWMAVGKLDGGE